MRLISAFESRSRLVFAALLLALPTPAAVITFNDGFEGASIDPFWTVSQNFGTVATSGALAHSGSQSAQFASVSGGQRDIILTHQFAGPVQGLFSIWFYDYAPGQETLYEIFSLSNSAQPGWGAAIGTLDYDAFCYIASVSGSGPGATCGIYPGVDTTNVARTAGWHLFSMNVTQSGTTLSIDSNPVYTNAGNYNFDTISLHVSGPFWRPNTLAFYDDFSMRAEETVPEPASVLLCGPILAAGVLLRRRVRRLRGA